MIELILYVFLVVLVLTVIKRAFWLAVQVINSLFDKIQEKL